MKKAARSLSGRKRTPKVERPKPSRTGEVGYGRPPRQHQFKPGQSGNPKGRRKGARNESTILAEILRRKIVSRSDGRVKKIPILEGILWRIAEDSLKGNTKSATFLLNRYAAMVSGELQQEMLSEDDQAVLEAFARRFQESAGGDEQR